MMLIIKTNIKIGKLFMAKPCKTGSNGKTLHPIIINNTHHQLRKSNLYERNLHYQFKK